MTISFPSNPSPDEIYDYNGTRYIWDGEKWVSGGSTLNDGVYVNRSGDSMTGPLTSSSSITADGDVQSGGSPLDSGGPATGTLLRSTSGIVAAAPAGTLIWNGKLTGQTGQTSAIYSDGSAQFAGNSVVITGSGNVKAGDPDNSAGSVLSPVGQTYVRQDGGNAFTPGYAVYNGGLGANDLVAAINFDGSASFSGGVTTSYVTTRVPTGETDSTWGGLNVLNSTGGISSQLFGDGSAKFAGTLDVQYSSVTKDRAAGVFGAESTAGSHAAIIARNYEADGYCFSGVNAAGDIAISMFANGSATFAGEVTVANEPNSGAAPGVQLQTAGVVSACRAGTAPLFYGWQEGNSTETSYITADGSALFGQFPSSLEINSDTVVKFNNSDEANIICRKTDSLYNASNAFEVQNNAGNVTASITGDGSASFAGDKFEVTATGSTRHGVYNNGAGIWVNSPGYIEVSRADGDVGDLWSGKQNLTETSSISSDGSATFAGTVNSTYSPGGGGYGFALSQPGGANTAGGLLQFDGGASQLFLKSVWGGAETVTLDGSDGSITAAGRAIVGQGTSSANDTVFSTGSGNGVFIQGNGDLTSKGTIAAERLESTGVGNGVIVKSPNGTRYSIVVDDFGNISTVAM